jgi:hypothetical protein
MRVGRSRSWTAWAASALLHALVVALLLRAGKRASIRLPLPPETESVEVEVRSSPPGAAPVARSPPGGPSPSPSPRQAGRGDEKVAPTSRSPSPAPAEPPTSTSPPSSQADEGVGGGPPIDLSFGALSDDVKGRVAGPAPEGALRARPRRFALDELRADFDRRRDAVANVDKGRVDPLMYDYLRGAKSRFQQQATRLAEDLSVGSGDAVRAWARGYMNTLDDINRGAIGAREDAPREGGGDTRNEKSEHADVLGQYGEAQRQAQSGAETRRAEVCLDVAAGRETSVVLRRSSGNAALDRLAVESFTKAADARPVPPDTRGGRACYELVISAFRMPPLPFVACSFDIGFSRPSCVWPFKKVTSVKGHLLTVEYSETAGAGGSGASRSPFIRKPR